MTWTTRTISDWADVIGGGTPSTRVADFWGGDIPWFTPAEIPESGAGIVSSSNRSITKAGLRRSSARMLPAGSVLVTSRASIGNCAIAGVPVATNQGFTSLVPKDLRSSRFLYYWVQQNRSQLLSRSAGSTFLEISVSKVRDIEICAPSPKEQADIGEAITAADDLIATLERLIVKKQAIKQGMMQQLLTGRTRLPGFTESWSVGVFDQLASPSRERAMPQSVAATTPLVDLDQIESGSGRLIAASQASDAASLKAVFRPGDVLFGKLRAYLRKFWYADVDGLCTTEIWVLRARTGASGRFVRYLVETDEFINVASGAYGTHMPRSDWGTVRNLPVAIPPRDEQVAIGSVLGDIDSEIVHLHQRLRKTRDLKQGMMQQLLAGRVRLPEKVVS